MVSGIRRVIHDLRVGVESVGGGPFAGRLIRSASSRVYRRTRLIVMEQDLAELTAIPVPDGVRIAPFDEEWAAVDQILTTRLRREFEKRLAAGRSCLIAWRGDSVVGYTWISLSIDPGIEGLPLALPQTASYGWDLFVRRSARGEGIGSALTYRRLSDSLEVGKTVGWRTVSPRNRPSLGATGKTGPVRILGEIRIETTFGLTRLTETRFEDRPLLEGR